jgi:hypothetical protein
LPGWGEMRKMRCFLLLVERSFDTKDKKLKGQADMLEEEKAEYSQFWGIAILKLLCSQRIV